MGQTLTRTGLRLNEQLLTAPFVFTSLCHRPNQLESPGHTDLGALHFPQEPVPGRRLRHAVQRAGRGPVPHERGRLPLEVAIRWGLPPREPGRLEDG